MSGPIARSSTNTAPSWSTRQSGAISPNEKNAQFELRDAIDRQRLLLRELDHRVKNALSGLLTLIELCRERESTVDDFACAIARRGSYDAHSA